MPTGIHTENASPNFYYPDKSGFAFDLPPQMVTWEWGATQEGGHYDIPILPRHDQTLSYTGWTQWVNHPQKDWRFGALSDKNAEASIFPNVHDPWMFTEYVYEGTGRTSDRDDAAGVGTGVVAPPLVLPCEVAREFDGPNITSSSLVYLNDQPPTYVREEQQTHYVLEDQWQSDATNEYYWTSDLEVMGWEEQVVGGEGNRKFHKTGTQRRVADYAAPTLNAGVRLYREQVWSHASRWGHSQNVPPRVVNMTAPASFVRPAGIFTNRIVPHITIKQGVPIYDNLTGHEIGQQRTVRYENVTVGLFSNDAKIGLWDVNPTGVDGPGSSVFTYATQADMTGADFVQMPNRDAIRNHDSRYRYTEKGFADNDLVHRGCAFWNGQAGVVRCQYYLDHASLFQVLDEQVETYTGSEDVVSVIDLDFALSASVEDVEVYFSHAGDASLKTMAECGKVVTLVRQPGQNHVTQIRIEQAVGSDPVKPLANTADGGFVNLPGNPASLTIHKVRRERPITHRSKCAISTRDAYKAAGGKCPFHTPHGVRTLAAYEGIASNGAEWVNLQQGLPPGYKTNPFETKAAQDALAIGGFADAVGGMGIGTGMAYSMIAAMGATDPFTDGHTKADTTRVEITYEPEIVSVARKETFYNTPDGLPAAKHPESDIRVRPGTGNYMLDEKAHEPFGGVDSPFFSMVNQINYRLQRNVQHCYRPDRCDTIITVPQGDRGFVRGRYSAINFTSHALRMPGYPAYDGTDSPCHYGNGYCPYNRLDRRAVEFDENYTILRDEILLPFRIGGVDAFAEHGLFEAYLIDGVIHHGLGQAELASPSGNRAICVAVTQESGDPVLLGHFQPVVNDTEEVAHRVYFFYDLPKWHPDHHRSSRVAAHLVQFNDEDEPCYMSFPQEHHDTIDLMYGGHATVPWLVELYNDYRRPTGNLFEVTNAKAFAGGRSPEYKDQSKRGHEIVCEWGYFSQSNVISSMDSNQFGGTRWPYGSVSDKGTRGYWTDANGEFILDGGRVGDLPTFDDQSATPHLSFAPISARITNKPGYWQGAAPIHGVPGITLTNPASPALNRSSDFALQGATYANDTKELIDWFHLVHHTEVNPHTGNVEDVTNWKNILPTVVDDFGNESRAPVQPPNPDTSMLPRERYAYRCDVCGIRYSEEEYNYFLTHEHLTDPLVEGGPAPSGVWCPRFDGGTVSLDGTYGAMLDTRARGHVDVWAPPGTTVKHDAFFWQTPTLINRTLQDQVTWKLGQYNAFGGGYHFQNLTPDVEQMGSLPVVTAKNYQPGLSNQAIGIPVEQGGETIYVPWAGVGSTVDQVRSSVRRLFNLDVPQLAAMGWSDVAYIQRVGNTSPLRVSPASEGSFTLNAGDLLQFYREIGNGSRRAIGLSLAVAGTAPEVLTSESIVSNYGAPPDPSDYPTTDQGLAQLELHTRLWVLSAVEGSLEHWATNLAASPNALAAKLNAEGAASVLGYPFSPGNSPGSSNIGGGAGPTDLDERIIAPYADSEGVGMPMLTLPWMKRLRNRVLPMLAYDLSTPGYTAGGDYTRESQHSHEDRFKQRSRPIPVDRLGTIEPQVVAATETGRDYYVEWEEYDLEGTRYRAFYPVGPTWWRTNQKVGQIKRYGGINPLHLDDPNQPDYTGNVITSTVAYFLHGRIPMDKEVVKAYVIFETDEGPSAQAIGCKGRYDGYEGRRQRDGSISPETLQYRGHSQCYWQHFHPWTTSHENDTGSWGDDGGLSMFDPSLNGGPRSREHWLNGGNPDPGAVVIYSDLDAQSDGFVPLTSHGSWLGNATEVYQGQTSLLGMQFVDRSYGFRFGQPFLGPWSWGEDLRQLVTEHEAWKDMDYQAYEDLRDALSCKCIAAVNSTEAMNEFAYLAPRFRDMVFQHEHQAIPGWLNFEGYQTSPKFKRGKVQIEEPKTDFGWTDGPQVIVQAESVGVAGSGASIGDYLGSGDEQRVVEITDVVRKAYNERVTRFYSLELGLAFDDLYDALRAKTDTNITTSDPQGLTNAGRAKRFHEDAQGYGEWIPQHMINYRYFKDGAGMWLNDPWHHPAIVAGQAISPDGLGDPITQTQADREARVGSVSDWDDQGLDTDDEDYTQYHPLSLCDADTGFDPGMVAGTNPGPSGSTSRYWRTESLRPNAQFFTMDLRQTPYENMRRNWRYAAPTVDASNATCPNTACFVNQNGWTMGQWAENAKSTWGHLNPPNMLSESCANCGTPLEGVQYKNGDGLVTASYDKAEQPDAIIRQIEVDTVTQDGWHTDAKHGFVIETFNFVSQQWRTLVQVSYNPDDGHYAFTRWNGSAWVNIFSQSHPTTLVGAEGGAAVNGQVQPKDPVAATGAHFIATPAMMIRYRVTQPAVVETSEPDSGYLTCTPDSATRTIEVATLTDLPGRYAGRTITLRNPTNGDTRATTITNVVANGDPVTSYTIWTAAEVDDAFTNYKIEWKSYVSRCTRLRVFGFPFRAGEVTMTPPGDVTTMMFSDGNDTMRLDDWVTQFTGAYASVGNDLSMHLIEHDTGGGDDFVWTIYPITYDGVTYYQVKSGRWFHDHASNSIKLPHLCRIEQGGQILTNAQTGDPVTIWDLNASLYASRALQVATVPSTVTFEYWRGIGQPMNVGVTAVGDGPSYQLDRECVNFIAGHSLVGGSVDSEPLPEGMTSDVIPYAGQSVRMARANTQDKRVTLDWHVYNHEPLVWPSTVGWLSGNELGPGQWDDNSVMGLFTGHGNGFNTADLGPHARLGGRVRGGVTMYGPPNSILSGDVLVYAKAQTERSYHLGPGVDPLVTRERTGGYASGAFVFRLTIDGTWASGRKSVSCSVPRVVIYLRERNMDESLAT